MALTDEQKFKIGFLLKCAEDGLTIAETHQKVKQAINSYQMAKQAELPLLARPFAWGADKATSGAISLAKMVPSIASTAATWGLGVPIAGGAAAGYGAAKLMSPDKNTVEDAKQDEIIAEYERLAEEAKRRTRIKRLQNVTGRRIVALSPHME